MPVVFSAKSVLPSTTVLPCWLTPADCLRELGSLQCQ
jgi:hypothetical protein